ncbi:uncharacterized protein LOC115883193 [Sitophilus oryzae]|uniref:Uncharacterized protein LOC115883193 n=1 Tax=Sitophilus oryzae TaxID=7048 RepID=A0A6J2Y355_SITOR|nr:uncharacterized protein LOC115883193 [Sitophilus oryzae]
MAWHSGYSSVLLLLLLIVQCILYTRAIQCYKCIFAENIYTTGESLCNGFDYSDKFIVDCPYSTYCMKKNTHSKIGEEQINGTERDCALQMYRTQKIRNGKWHQEIEVEEPYVEGCKTTKDKGLRTPFIEHCYCKGDLCNNAFIPKGNLLLYISIPCLIIMWL